MPALPKNYKKALLALAPHAATAAPFCRAIVEGRFFGRMHLREICLASGIASARSSAVEAVLEAGVSVDLIIKSGDLEWRPHDYHAGFEQLAIALEGISTYMEYVHSDETEVTVVLTPPEKPSMLESVLIAHGYVGSMVEHTDAIFKHIAVLAKKRFLVMTPFIDNIGMTNLISSWESTKKHVEKILITRHTAGNPNIAITDNQSKLNCMGVKIYNYWLQKGDRYETFHAKVLLADSNFAYVGSANATKASLELSMELGVMLKGNGAKTVSEIADAVLRIAMPIN